MPIKRGTKLPSSIGYIRTVCPQHKAAFECSSVNSKRTHVPIEAKSQRLNCNYCGAFAKFISIPEALTITTS